MLRHLFCCCSCCSNGPPGVNAGSAGEYQSLAPQRAPAHMRRMSLQEAEADASVQIEIDDENEENDQLTNGHSQQHHHADVAASAQLLLAPERASPRHAPPRSPVSLQAPAVAYSFPDPPQAASSIPSAAYDDAGDLTSQDLEVTEQHLDQDIQRFRAALEDAQQAELQGHAAATPEPQLRPPTRPAPVNLPRTRPRAPSASTSAGPVRSPLGIGVGSASARAPNDAAPRSYFARNNAHRVPSPIALPSSTLPTVRKPPQMPMHSPAPSHPLRTLQSHLSHPAPATAAAATAFSLVHSPSAPALSSLLHAAAPPPEPLVVVTDAAPSLAGPEASVAVLGPIFGLPIAPSPSERGESLEPQLLLPAAPIAQSPAAQPQLPLLPAASSTVPARNAAPTAALAASHATPARKPSRGSAANASQNPLDRLGVPAGAISPAHIEALMRSLKHPQSAAAIGVGGISDVSYETLFSFVAATSRSLSGSVLRPWVVPELQAIVDAHAGGAGKTSPPQLKRSASVSLTGSHPSGSAAAAAPKPAGGGLSLESSQLLLSFVHWLREIRVDAPARTLTMTFDFGAAASGKYAYFTAPSCSTMVLASGHPTDKFLLHPLNQVATYKSDAHKLCIHREMQLQLDERGGIKSVRSGDVSLQKFVSLNVSLRTEYRPGMVEYDSSKRAFIHAVVDSVTGREKAVVREGRYMPRTFDWWLVCSVMKQESWIGLPPIGTPAPPNLAMKPHAGYAYP